VEQDRVSLHYQITSEELRKSVLEGCGFCKTLADGIHGKVFLDELYERLENSDSCSGINDSDDVESRNETLDEESKDVEPDWTDASTFNEEELDDDITGGWDTWKERDSLIEACQFGIDISFEKGHAGLFTFVNTHIEAVDNVDRPNDLQKLQGAKAVALRYHVGSKGMFFKISMLGCLPKARDNGPDISPICPPWTTDCMLGTETNMKILEEWMRNLEPISESVTTTSNHLPSRLIQLNDENRLRVVHTSAIEGCELKFAALSYVWGANQSFILLSSTEDLLTTGFEAEQLPKTIQDAVIVTSRIGLQYIWVDAL
jgi:hypothetical protein